MKQNGSQGAKTTTETKARQGAPGYTIWVLLASVALAAVVGAMLLFNTDEFPPSTQRNPVENAPVSGSQPTTPQGQPQTRQ